ncbi:MAG: GH25 family lysozyme [Sarcina sp.]
MNSMNIKGIDISNWQYGISLLEAKNKGVQIVYIKISEGVNYIDPCFKEFYKTAKSLGLDIGFYHFLHPSISGVAQAEFMYEQIKNLECECKIVIDIEVTDEVNNIEVNQCINDFAEKIKELSQIDSTIYTDLNFANSVLDKSVVHLGLWQAEYGVAKPTSSNLFGKDILGWQYSDSGNFLGTTDMDMFDSKIYCEQINYNYYIGELVKIKENAITYVTNQNIPEWVKEGIYTIEEVDNEKVLLKEIQSWVYIYNIEKLQNFVVGDEVKILNTTEFYATGQSIPLWVKENTYSISEVNGNKVLLEQIESWVYKENVELV